MAINLGTELLSELLNDTLFFGIDWFISLFLVVLTLIAITNDFDKWKVLVLPVTVAWHIIGITPSFVLYIVGTISFVIGALSISTIGNAFSTITRSVTTLGQTRESIKAKRIRTGVADSMFKAGIKKEGTVMKDVFGMPKRDKAGKIKRYGSLSMGGARARAGFDDRSTLEKIRERRRAGIIKKEGRARALKEIGILTGTTKRAPSKKKLLKMKKRKDEEKAFFKSMKQTDK